MKIKQIGIFLMLVLFLFACKDEEITTPGTILLTVGSKKDLKSLLNSEMKNISSWSSDNTANVSVDSKGNVTSNKTSFTSAEGGSNLYRNGPATVSTKIKATAKNGTTQIFTVVATTQGQEDISSVTPLKNYFPSTFLVGNIAPSANLDANLKRHFNTVTAENLMKPSEISDSRNTSTGVISYKWTNADNFVANAQAAGMKVIGHTLLWHSQIPSWQSSMSTATKEVALAAMKKFISEVMTRYKGKIYSWDVLNEIFPDGASSSDWKTAMRQENPWFKAIGSDFVYEGFLAARQADPGAKLYYNDYNTNNNARATLIRDMVKAVNDKYATETNKPDGEPAGRLLIEGIGMQEHHNTGVSAASIRTTLSMFKAIGVKVAVSELDVLAQDWGSFNPVGDGANKQNSSTVTNNGLLTQANLYAQYMGVYAEFKDIIERISIWGITDNNSWRSGGLPLLFDSNGKAKPAYYKFVGAIPSNW